MSRQYSPWLTPIELAGGRVEARRRAGGPGRPAPFAPPPASTVPIHMQHVDRDQDVGRGRRRRASCAACASWSSGSRTPGSACRPASASCSPGRSDCRSSSRRRRSRARDGGSRSPWRRRTLAAGCLASAQRGADAPACSSARPSRRAARSDTSTLWTPSSEPGTDDGGRAVGQRRPQHVGRLRVLARAAASTPGRRGPPAAAGSRSARAASRPCRRPARPRAGAAAPATWAVTVRASLPPPASTPPATPTPAAAPRPPARTRGGASSGARRSPGARARGAGAGSSARLPAAASSDGLGVDDGHDAAA